MLKVLIPITVAIGLTSVPVIAQEFPERPVRVVVPFGAGGGSDTLVRVIQEAVGQAELLPEPMVVVNVPGAGSGVGTRRVSDATPDGYEILFNHVAILSNEIAGNTDVSYRDFEPIVATGEMCTIPMVREDAPYTSLEELVNAAASEPDTVLAGVNMGGLNHTAGLMMQAGSDAEFRFVQIGGGAKVFAALLGGHVQVGFFTGAEAVNYGAQGLRPLAVFSPERDPSIPDLPTAAELGYDVTLCTMNMWFAPKGTPEATVDTLRTAISGAMETPFAQQKLADFRLLPTVMGGADLDAALDAQDEALSNALGG